MHLNQIRKLLNSSLCLLLLILPVEVFCQVIDSTDMVAIDSDSVGVQQFEPISEQPAITFDLRSVPDSIVNELQGQDVFWYANEEWMKTVQRTRKKTFMDTQWFNTLMWILVVGAFISAVIWYLATTNFSFFSKRRLLLSSQDEESGTENIFEINYSKEIAKAVDAGNFRLATRLMYLRLLKNLSERNIIVYKHDRTNFDYLMQLYNTTHYNDFFRLTRNYEFAWYGQFDPGKEGYNIIRSDFENFNRKLNIN